MGARSSIIDWLFFSSASLLVLACSQETIPMGTGGGGTGGTPECVKPQDCIVEVPECRKLYGCVEGSCVYNEEPQGKELSTQALGDCVRQVCDGMGFVEYVPDESDYPIDDSPCTDYYCDGTTAVKTVYPSIPCYTGPEGTEGVGTCIGGMMACNEVGLPEGACEGEVLPIEQMCGAEDTDCDGQAGPPCP